METDLLNCHMRNQYSDYLLVQVFVPLYELPYLLTLTHFVLSFSNLPLFQSIFFTFIATFNSGFTHGIYLVNQFTPITNGIAFFKSLFGVAVIFNNIVGAEEFRQFFHLLATQAIDDARFARVILDELHDLLVDIFRLLADFIVKVRTVEGGDISSSTASPKKIG